MRGALCVFNKLTKKQEEIYHMCAKKAGLTDTKFWVLYALCETGGELCQNSFCETWCYSKQTVNTAVALLEKEGIVSLTFAEGSRKQKDIRLTDAGEAFCNQHIRPILEAEEASLMGLKEEERNTFLSVYAGLIHSLEDALNREP